MRKLFFIFIIVGFEINILVAFNINSLSQPISSEAYSYSPEGIVINNNNLFIVNRRSLQIYHIDTDSLIILSELELPESLRNIKLYNNVLYISTIWSTLYQVDISDILTPEVVGSINYVGCYAYFINNNRLFVHELLYDWTFLLHIYDADTFEELFATEYPNNTVTLVKVDDNIAFNDVGEDAYLYDISDPANILLLGSHPVGVVSMPKHTTIYSDSLLIISSQSSHTKIYNISDISNWQFVCTLNEFFDSFRISNNKLVGFYFHDRYIYDLTDIFDPILMDHETEIDAHATIEISENDLYLTLEEGHLKRFDISESEFDLVNDEYSYGWLQRGFIDGYYMYILSQIHGLMSWHLDDLFNPNFVSNILPDFIGYRLINDQDIAVLHGKNNTANKYNYIIQYENGLFTVIDTLQSNFILSYKPEYGFYIMDNEIFYRYQLNENGLELIDQLSIPGLVGGDVNIKDDTAFILTPWIMTTVSNIDQIGEMEVTSSQATELHSYQQCGFYENYMFLTEDGSYSNLYIYDISTPEDPVYITTVYNSGYLGIDEENALLFLGNVDCSIYDLSNIDLGFIFEIEDFQGWSDADQVVPFCRNNENYLFYLEDCAAHFYEYTMTGSDDNDLPNLCLKLSNYPNPFNPLTTITFEIPDPGKAQLNIYNVKGQKINQLMNDFIDKGSYDLVWDGTDSNNNPVESGIYLYQLKLNNQVIDSKKCILLK